MQLAVATGVPVTTRCRSLPGACSRGRGRSAALAAVVFAGVIVGPAMGQGPRALAKAAENAVEAQRYSEAIELLEKAVETSHSKARFVERLAEIKQEGAQWAAMTGLSGHPTDLERSVKWLGLAEQWAPKRTSVAVLRHVVESEIARRRAVLAEAIEEARAGRVGRAVQLGESVASRSLEAPETKLLAEELELQESLRKAREQVEANPVAEEAFHAVSRLIGPAGSRPAVISLRETVGRAQLAIAQELLAVPDLAVQDVHAGTEAILRAEKVCSACPTEPIRGLVAERIDEVFGPQLEQYRSLGPHGAVAADVLRQSLIRLSPQRATTSGALPESWPDVVVSVDWLSPGDACDTPPGLPARLTDQLPTVPPGSRKSPAIDQSPDLVVRVSLTQCESRAINPREVQVRSSSYRAGSQQIANPEYARLQENVNAATTNLRTAQLNLANSAQNMKAFYQGQVLGGQISLGMLQGKLNRTPPYLERPVIQPYTYEEYEKALVVSVAGSISLVDAHDRGVLVVVPVESSVEASAWGRRGVFGEDVGGLTNSSPQIPETLAELADHATVDVSERALGIVTEYASRWALVRAVKARQGGSDRGAAAWMVAEAILSNEDAEPGLLAPDLVAKLLANDPHAASSMVPDVATFCQNPSAKSSTLCGGENRSRTSRGTAEESESSASAAVLGKATDYRGYQERRSTGSRTGRGGSCESGHQIEVVSLGGEFVILEDMSVWKVDGLEALETSLWHRGNSVTRCDSRLVNMDLNEVVTVEQVSRASGSIHAVEAADDGLFVINGAIFEAKTYCSVARGDEVLFIDGSASGVCVSASLLSLGSARVCRVWCK